MIGLPPSPPHPPHFGQGPLPRRDPHRQPGRRPVRTDPGARGHGCHVHVGPARRLGPSRRGGSRTGATA